jgi:hypothetical protein
VADNDCACGVCAKCLLRALANMPDAIDRITAQPPERLASVRPGLIERLRADRLTWHAKRDEKDAG